MTSPSAFIQEISDTARWAAALRARESSRPDRLFRDPFAERLAGVRGFEIAENLTSDAQSTSWAMRTYLFDQFIEKEIASGVDLVLNLGAGLDARPYRMTLPPGLHWIEVDTPDILDYKKAVLSAEGPRCNLERISMDLRDRRARQILWKELGLRAGKVLVISEGLLIYLPAEEVAALSAELAENGFVSWILELVSAEALEKMRQDAGSHLPSGDSFQFAPADGATFFVHCGWKLARREGILKTAVRLGRTPIHPKFLPFIPDEATSRANGLPWMGVYLLQRNTRRRATEIRPSIFANLVPDSANRVD